MHESHLPQVGPPLPVTFCLSELHSASLLVMKSRPTWPPEFILVSGCVLAQLPQKEGGWGWEKQKFPGSSDGGSSRNGGGGEGGGNNITQKPGGPSEAHVGRDAPTFS